MIAGFWEGKRRAKSLVVREEVVEVEDVRDARCEERDCTIGHSWVSKVSVEVGMHEKGGVKLLVELLLFHGGSSARHRIGWLLLYGLLLLLGRWQYIAMLALVSKRKPSCPGLQLNTW